MGLKATIGSISQAEWDEKLMNTSKTLADLDSERAQNVDNIEGTNVEILQIPKLDTAPSNPSEGDMYYDTNTNTYKYYDGSAWKSVKISVTEV